MIIARRPALFEYFNRNDFGLIPKTPLTGLPSPNEDAWVVNDRIAREISDRGLRIITTVEKEGREIHDIIPIQGKESAYSNEGSDYFPFHVEVPQASVAERPDYVMLVCLRGNPDAKTYVTDFARVIQLMDPQDVEILSKPWFIGKCGASYGTDATYITEILDKEGNVTLNLGNMVGSCDDARRVLLNMQMVIKVNFKTLVSSFSLKPGDFLLFDNKKALHARSSFVSSTVFDGSHRWLKRVYLKHG